MADGPSARIVLQVSDTIPTTPRTNDKIWPMFSEIGRIVRGGFPDRGSCIGSLQEHGDEAIFRAALGNGRCGRAVHGSQRAPPSKRYHPRSKRRNGSPDLFASISTRGLLEPPSTTRCGFSHGAAIFRRKGSVFPRHRLPPEYVDAERRVYKSTRPTTPRWSGRNLAGACVDSQLRRGKHHPEGTLQASQPGGAASVELP